MRESGSIITVLLLTLGLAGCRGLAPHAPPVEAVGSVPVRFLVSFDDGPSAAARNNSTARILDVLAHNRYQPGIKAIFFVQTRHPVGGGTAVGQALLARIHEEGHVVGLHTASAHGHVNHTRMPIADLDRTLEDGVADIRAVTGAAPRFLRPPYWAHNDATVARYRAHGLTMLLDDISIRDGKVRGYNSNPHVRSRIHADLARAARRIERGELPALGDYIPLVLTLHDTNPTTARDLEAYLGMLIGEARAVGLTVHPEPFVSPAEELARVAAVRGDRPVLAQNEPQRTQVVMSP
jgi:peptidoglycan/xylan/chitin deacetylase (PgdA/CDA1 family)